ncbi:MAG: TlpA disulfide reductase family protein [Thermoguttaceae bacterium]|nr:TlpA disulfide reductase family protein [Thermoguttaceae bacterium]
MTYGRFRFLRVVSVLSVAFFSFVFLTNCNQGFTQDELISLEDVGGGPCFVGPDGQLVCSTEKPQAAEAADEDSDEESPKIDLATQPWLVESANLPTSHPALKRDHMIWADSYLWTSIDDVVGAIPVEKWLTKAPTPEDLAGKYILIEVWATWCPPCRRSLPYLDFISKKYKDDLVVVSICEMDENAIRNMPGNKLNIFDVGYFAAVDTGRRLANKLGVYGIPHAILLEPTVGGVVWEGMPTSPRYELDDKKLERFFRIGQKLKEAGKMPEVSPVKFEESEPTQEERASRRQPNAKQSVDDIPGAPSL